MEGTFSSTKNKTTVQERHRNLLHSNMIDQLVLRFELPKTPATIPPQTDMPKTIQRSNMFIIQVIHKLPLIIELPSARNSIRFPLAKHFDRRFRGLTFYGSPSCKRIAVSGDWGH
jgi:hypothetical protein